VEEDTKLPTVPHSEHTPFCTEQTVNVV